MLRESRHWRCSGLPFLCGAMPLLSRLGGLLKGGRASLGISGRARQAAASSPAAQTSALLALPDDVLSAILDAVEALEDRVEFDDDAVAHLHCDQCPLRALGATCRDLRERVAFRLFRETRIVCPPEDLRRLTKILAAGAPYIEASRVSLVDRVWSCSPSTLCAEIRVPLHRRPRRP